MTSAKQSQFNDLSLLASLYAAELALLLAALSFHKKGGRAATVWITTTPGVAFVLSALVVLAAAVWVGAQYVRSRRAKDHRFGLIVLMNLITVAFVFVSIEIALRLLSHDTADAPAFVGTVLLPRSWEKAVAHNLGLVEKASGDLSYLVYDDELGWTVGANRRSVNGLYLSSAEGLRSARQGVVLSAPKERLRVALVGDSYTFAERVAFEDSWGHVLETKSGMDLQVLNFGVGGYGVDQAYLRFKKDAVAWKPDVAILGFPMHDLSRTLILYPFINWPEWGIPYSKPRLVRRNGELHALNIPTVTPKAMFAMRSASDLTFLEYEAGYSKDHWQWSVADVFYTKRWLQSYFPSWPVQSEHVSDDELVRLNGAILRAFIQSATEHGAVPLVVFFPSRPELPRLIRGEKTPWQGIRERLGVPLLDTTPCLLELGYEDAYVPGDPHYSPSGNAAVAKCVGNALRQIVKERRSAGRSVVTGR